MITIKDEFLTCTKLKRAIRAGGYEVLASAWANYADWGAGPRKESASQIADRYATQAGEWRQRHGASATGAGTRHPTRADGYSDDVSSEEV